MLSSGVNVGSRSVVAGIVIGIIVGGLIGYVSAPAPDYTPYEDQITELESQITSLQDEILQLQSQVGSLQNQLDVKDETIDLLKTQLSSQDALNEDLIDQIDVLMQICNYTPGSWYEIGAWTGSEYMKTEAFHVPSSPIRIEWSLDVNPLSDFTISLYREVDDKLVLRWSNLQNESEGKAYGDVRPGPYYLEFSADEIEYNVTVDVLIETTSTLTYLEVDISPRKLMFRTSETIAFNIECSQPHNNSYIEIWNPTGRLIWRTANMTKWSKNDDRWIVPYYYQVTTDRELMSLETNCTLGTWGWVWNSETKSVSGNFEVLQGA